MDAFWREEAYFLLRIYGFWLHLPFVFISSLSMNEINFQKFYNAKIVAQVEKQNTNSEQKVSKTRAKKQQMLLSILGPREFWKKFDKQVDALDTASKESNDYDMLCTFVYQVDNGYRKFIVIHPETYWQDYKYLPPERRCSYEVRSR